MAFLTSFKKVRDVTDTSAKAAPRSGPLPGAATEFLAAVALIALALRAGIRSSARPGGLDQVRASGLDHVRASGLEQGEDE